MAAPVNSLDTTPEADAWPRPDPALRALAVIPARNEVDLLPLALRALQGQVDLAGQPLAGPTFEVLVLANNCTDRTAEVARACARCHPEGPPIHVAEVEWPPDQAHVGTARRWLMDQAARRLEAVGRPEGLILSTDADTVVAPDWVAAQLREVAHGADAVAGLILLDRAGWQGLPPATRRGLRQTLVHRGRILQLEALLDPDPLDPPPRHDFHGGASLGITARAYRRVGGLPPLRSLEDVALAEALWRVDARFVHSNQVRVVTSPRLDARADGGHGSALASRDTRTALARTGAAIEAELRTRAALRHQFRLKQRAGPGWSPDPEPCRALAGAWGVAADRLAALLRSEATFGRWLEALGGFSPGPTPPAAAQVPIREANRDLRQRVRALRLAAGQGATGRP